MLKTIGNTAYIILLLFGIVTSLSSLILSYYPNTPYIGHLVVPMYIDVSILALIIIMRVHRWLHNS